jgi:hypothetical protein
MKPTNKIIIYDDSCPMCSVYTKAFVRTGFITQEGRRSFSNIDAEILKQLDNYKCRNEIPLVDTSNNSVKYGIDALLEILNVKIPLIKTIGTFKPVNWFLKKLYNLISFNRRVITASKLNNNGFDCTPDFNLKYRLLFLFLGLSFNTIMLIPEFRNVLSKSAFNNTSAAKLQSAHFALVLVNVALALKLSGRKALEFLGQINVLALLTTLLLLPLCLLNSLFIIPATLNDVLLLILFLFILTEYKRRMKFANVLKNKIIVAVNLISTILFLSYLIIG